MTDKEILEQANKDGCFAVVFRHAEKDLNSKQKPINVLLTERGKKSATDFGVAIETKKPIRLFHSFIKRCEQTADSIIEGYRGKVVQKKVEEVLSGHYLFDAKKVIEESEKTDKYNFITNWYSGNYSRKNLMSFVDARQMMIETIKANYNPDFLDIYITHDWNVVLLYSFCYDIKKADYPWPEFMDGVCFFKNGNKFSIMCQAGKKIEIG